MERASLSRICQEFATVDCFYLAALIVSNRRADAVTDGGLPCPLTDNSDNPVACGASGGIPSRLYGAALRPPA